MGTTGETTVTLRDAVLLAHALVARCLEETGVRAVVLKGVGAERHGLRERRTSADVDVIVPPAGMGPLGESLRRRGWVERTADPDEFAFPVHSVSFSHPSWPCDIDVHFRFPGLEAPALEVFEALWERHERIRIAGRDVAVPDRADSFVVLAVHALRSPWVERHRLELDALRALAPAVGLDALLDSATRLGALACARPLLEPLVAAASSGPVDGSVAPSSPVDVAGSVEWGEVSDEWALRTGLSDPFARRLLSLRRADWPRRFHLVRLAVLPPRQVLGALSPGRPSGGLPLLLAYLRRWRRGVVALPRAVVSLRHSAPRSRAAARRG